MSSAEKIIALCLKRRALEKELAEVKELQARLARALDDKGIGRITANKEKVNVVVKPYAIYFGEGSGGEVLRNLDLEEFSFLGYNSQGLGGYLSNYLDLEEGETFEDCFKLKKVAWFQR